MTKVPSLQLLALGPSGTPLDLGDPITLDTGLELSLVWVEDMIPIFRANPEGSPPEMWTNHLDRPGLYIWAGLWPDDTEPLDVDAALDKALAVQDQAEVDFFLDDWAPRVIRRALAPGEAA